MKKQILLFPLLLVALIFTGCSNDDNTQPEPVNEEEVITTMTVILSPSGGGTVVTLQKKDLDGDDGPNQPVITVSGNLTAGTTYSGVIQVLNETETPAENITEEVLEEANEHQFFFTPAGGLNVSTTYSDQDDNGNPLGVQFALSANTASSGTLTVTLRHEPTKPNTGLSDAGGQTDIEATFNVTVE